MAISNRQSTNGGAPVVSVFGSNDAPQGQAEYRTARAVGRKLAELGYVVANGGYGGIMEASARGAKEAGGRTIGVVCSLWKSPANRYIDRVIRTHSHAQRLETLIEIAQAGYVVLPGATGSLVELATVWERMCKGLLTARPLVCMGRFWHPLIELMCTVRPACAEFIAIADDSDELPRYFKACKPA